MKYGGDVMKKILDVMIVVILVVFAGWDEKHFLVKA